MKTTNRPPRPTRLTPPEDWARLRNLVQPAPEHHAVASDDLGQYAALLARDERLAEEAFPGIAAHLAGGCRRCAPLLEEYLVFLQADQPWWRRLWGRVHPRGGSGRRPLPVPRAVQLAPRFAALALVASLTLNAVWAGRALLGDAPTRPGSALAAPPDQVAMATGPTPTPGAVEASTDPVRGSVLLSDDFSSEASAVLPKASRDPNHVAQGYSPEGDYSLRKVDPAYTREANAIPLGRYTNAALAVDVRLVGEVEGRYVVVGCRRSDDNSATGYRLALDPNRGLVALFRAGDPQKTLQAWQPYSAFVVHRGNATNRVVLSCAGSQITGYVNGTKVVSVEDTEGGFHDGRMVLGTGAFSDITAERRGVVEARFDNLMIVEQ